MVNFGLLGCVYISTSNPAFPMFSIKPGRGSTITLSGMSINVYTSSYIILYLPTLYCGRRGCMNHGYLCGVTLHSISTLR